MLIRLIWFIYLFLHNAANPLSLHSFAWIRERPYSIVIWKGLVWRIILIRHDPSAWSSHFMHLILHICVSHYTRGILSKSIAESLLHPPENLTYGSYRAEPSLTARSMLRSHLNAGCTLHEMAIRNISSRSTNRITWTFEQMCVKIVMKRGRTTHASLMLAVRAEALTVSGGGPIYRCL